ncbi:hypothetical protein T484DRAFT_1800171 [Baffinella frigidus]|nr:hypothetical protein T484DRAFT_1800171 [Cryptophyta sp. CCMP2293]
MEAGSGSGEHGEETPGGSGGSSAHAARVQEDRGQEHKRRHEEEAHNFSDEEQSAPKRRKVGEGSSLVAIKTLVGLQVQSQLWCEALGKAQKAREVEAANQDTDTVSFHTWNSPAGRLVSARVTGHADAEANCPR